MAPSLLLCTQIVLFLVLLSLTRISRADVPVLDAAKELSLHLATDELDWPTSLMPMYDGVDIDEIEMEDDDGDASTTAAARRSLFWRRMGYYISYGALSANRVPCPPRSGRSYYTHDCWRARGVVRPYTRGCSTITRCRR
ncbi:protein RALF-like 34 [Cynara cardunculus var. scolymus]|uniref:Rapid ALkalinization Factor n=1 Tax=Cynara cardunculus var. scolymus TaxID=59895 RepID=A0A103XKP0_CYNCS|nr:protein RALF-like 34 [Cynara cardunculus var. scolymus]XP_024978124.1 protein RALF-like 34 [Cynara cardunculus var. scolymus]KVH92522.1 Rapid ALkalinization Factor [Cynara cardunculus var. scolymus]